MKFLLDLIAGNHNEKVLNKLQTTVQDINTICEQQDNLSDQEVQAKTSEFKDRLAQGTPIDDILPEAFATVKQACKRLSGQTFDVKGDKRTRNMVPYNVQILGAIVLHQGKIAEMKTGEGKTLVAAMPVYLNALTGKGVHVVTVNDYLASRDAQWMGNLYERLGLSIGCVTKGVDINRRKEEYAKDITYVENSELGFDYLRDNLAKEWRQRNLLRRPLHYAIIDEVDSILIDEARTPLIISQPRNVPVDKYHYYAKIARGLTPSKEKRKVSKGFLHELLHETKKKQKKAKELNSGKDAGADPDGSGRRVAPKAEESKTEQEGDFYIDEKTKTALLSSKGIQKLENMLGVENLYQDIGYEEIHHIENALKAQGCYRKDQEYMVSGGEVMIIDEHTGRAMKGRRFSEGLHQAIEAKEGVEIKQESQTMATITYQNFFKLYEKLAGMTGTATTEGEEFDKIYDLEVLAIPTNRPIIRVDKSDHVYYNQQAKWNKIIDRISFAHQMQQPILIGTSSIQTSEYVSSLLDKAGITHSVLNAKHHEHEAHIVANAGKAGSVVVATNMAGRGTDIKLQDNLNDIIAANYAQRLEQEIKTIQDTDDRDDIILNMYSQTEYDLTIQEVQDYFSLDHTALEQMNTKQGYEYKDCIRHITTLKPKNNTNIHTKIIITKHQSRGEPVSPSKNKQQKKSMFAGDGSVDIHYGLSILGTEKHDSRRIDNQLRGRAGRQGDPGVSVFYVALDDTIMRKMGGSKMQTVASMMLPKSELQHIELTQKQFTNAIVRAQKQMEAWHFGIRKHLFEYDSVVDKQRQTIYAERENILQQTREDTRAEELKDGKEEGSFDIFVIFEKFLSEVVKRIVYLHEVMKTDEKEFRETIQKNFGLMLTSAEYEEHQDTLSEFLLGIFRARKDRIIEKIGETQAQDIFVKLYLQSIDKVRVDHIDAMHRLREQVGLMGYAQQDPLVVYKKEAYEKYQALRKRIKEDTVGTILRIDYTKAQAPTTPSQQSQEQHTMMNMLQSVAKDITAQASSAPSGQGNTGKVYEKSDDFEVFEADSSSSHGGGSAEQVIDLSDKKLRPNDKITVKYTNGTYEYDVKYKKVKKDIEAGECEVVE